jgi:hypothetical protein
MLFYQVMTRGLETTSVLRIMTALGTGVFMVLLAGICTRFCGMAMVQLDHKMEQLKMTL